jgi:hypothetical protein
MKIEFSRQGFDTQLTNFMKIHPVGAELFHTDTYSPNKTFGVGRFINFYYLKND